MKYIIVILAILAIASFTNSTCWKPKAVWTAVAGMNDWCDDNCKVVSNPCKEVCEPCLSGSVSTPTCKNWTPFISRDVPTAYADAENIESMLLENRIPATCISPTQIEVRTVVGKIPAASTGEIFKYNNPNQGFLCINDMNGLLWANSIQEAPCSDYEVRFCCETCKNWSNWVSRDIPTAYADAELLVDMLKEKKIPATCTAPTQIQARTVADKIPAYATGNEFANYSPSEGLLCINANNGGPTYANSIASAPCKDYEVRFCCDRKMCWVPNGSYVVPGIAEWCTNNCDGQANPSDECKDYCKEVAC